MSDIAERAGVATGTLYLYFDAKEALVLALSEQFFETLAVVIDPATQHQDMRVVIADSVWPSLAHIVERAAEVCLLYGGGDTARYEVEVVRMLQHALLPFQEESP